MSERADLLTAGEVAARLGLSVRKVYALAGSGERIKRTLRAPCAMRFPCVHGPHGSQEPVFFACFLPNSSNLHRCRMSRFSTGGYSTSHGCRRIGNDHYRLSWVVDYYYQNSMLRHPRTFTRDTDTAGALKFAAKWRPLRVPDEIAARL